MSFIYSLFTPLHVTALQSFTVKSFSNIQDGEDKGFWILYLTGRII